MKSERAPLPCVPDDLRRRGGLPGDVAAYVRRLILTGVLKPGTKIDQDAVSESLDVSRSPIREALVILGQEGLLDVTPRRGASVALLTPASRQTRCAPRASGTEEGRPCRTAQR
jgi:DNA-binding GntR family transcriptional regulator